jgi:hypothetical protein
VERAATLSGYRAMIEAVFVLAPKRAFAHG